MRKNNSIVLRLLARLLIVSFFLQNCDGLANPALLEVDSKEVAYQPILDKELIADGGHLITPYEYKGQLCASVEIVDGKDKVFNVVPIEIQEGMDVGSLLHLPKKVQAGRIHVVKSSKGKPAKVVIYKEAGLVGGMQEGDDNEKKNEEIKEGETEKNRRKKDKGKEKEGAYGQVQGSTNPISKPTQSSSSLSSSSISTGITSATKTSAGISHSHYGGDIGNEIFQRRSISITKASANHIKTLEGHANQKGKPLSSFFKYFLGIQGTGLAQKRREVAIETKSEDGSEFGVFREVNPKLFQLMGELGYKPNIESLFDIDKRNDLLALIQRRRVAPFTGASVGAFVTDLPLEKYGIWRNRLCSCFLELFNSDKINNEWIENRQKTSRYKMKALPYNPNNFLYGKTTVPSNDYREISECYDTIASGAPSKEILRQEMGINRKEIPTNIYQLDMNVKLGSRYIPSTKIYFTINKETDENFATSEEREIWLRNNSRIVVFHPYPEYIDFFLKDAAIRWQRAVEWNKQNIEDLKELLASYCYIMFHAAPFKRGSASILEWSLKAICFYHNIDIVWKNFGWGSLDQIALSTPTMDEFIQKFKQEVSLTPINND